MTSDSRSSSAVRNLRSIFENKTSDSNTSDSRGRSPNGLGSDKENSYHQPKSKVRASFVAVEPVPGMAASVENAGGRRGSFGEADVDMELKKTISEQKDDLAVPEAAVESMPTSVAATPLRPPNEGRLGHDDPVAISTEEGPANPDKPVTGAAEEPGDMKPADPATEDAVSGGEALPAMTEDLRSTSRPTPSSSKAAKKPEPKKTPTNSKPPAISTQTASKPSSASVKSPASQPKTPVSGNAPSATESPAAKRPPRSSLTAPTAASMARSGAATEKPKTSPDSKPKSREVTKPLNISSHLTAPTAASKAKHEPEAAAANTSTFRASLTSRPKPPPIPSSKPPARTSLAAGHRPQSQGSQTSGRRSLAAVDGNFLDRMMRPTAASSGRTQEKVAAVQSPPKAKPSKPKANGQLAKSTSTNAAVHEIELENGGSSEAGNNSGLTLAANSTTIDDAMAAVEDQGIGNETPNHHSLEQAAADGALEATPAGLGGEETIR